MQIMIFYGIYISNIQDEAYFKEISSKIFKILILQIVAWHFERIIDVGCPSVYVLLLLDNE